MGDRRKRKKEGEREGRGRGKDREREREREKEKEHMNTAAQYSQTRQYVCMYVCKHIYSGAKTKRCCVCTHKL